MIKHHPTDLMLRDFAQANLPESVSVAVAIHVEMCDHCQQKVAAMQAELAQQEFSSSAQQQWDDSIDLEWIEQITADTTKDLMHLAEPFSIEFKGSKANRPRALQHLSLGDWQTLGKISRSRVKLDDGAIRSSLLHIDAQGDVPHHTHNGFEITLLLDGEFSDEMGAYHVGDFIVLDGEHNHQPRTEHGCLCYTVVSDSLHFTQGMSRLLNPLGRLIY
jgi:putative transcriptional regulator